MRLEEAEQHLTPQHRTIINPVGENEIVVKKLPPDTTDKPYIVIYVKDPKKPLAFNGGLLGEYSSLDEVQNHLIGLSFASDIDSNGWFVSPETSIASL